MQTVKSKFCHVGIGVCVVVFGFGGGWVWGGGGGGCLSAVLTCSFE